MTLALTLKRIVGQGIWFAGLPSFTLRRLLEPLGMRVHQEWVPSAIATVELATGKRAKMCGARENYLTFTSYWKGWKYFSPYSILTALALSEDKDVFVDIGANVGYYSLTMASRGLPVVAFEPHLPNFQLLCGNAALNNPHIQCIQAAVSDRSGEATFHAASSPLSGSLDFTFNPQVLKSYRVRAVTLDDFVEEHPLPERMLIKAIIQGYEPEFIRGARRTIERCRPEMILCVGRRYDDETMGLLREQGYRFYKITDEGLVEEEHLDVHIRGRWLFLEHLATTRPQREVLAINNALRLQFGSRTSSSRTRIAIGRSSSGRVRQAGSWPRARARRLIRKQSGLR
jgi:FkbM family methyltransferase